MSSFGEQIRRLRQSKNLTLRSLAEQSNLSYSFIGSLEKGRYNPSRESIYSLAKPLDTDVNELLKLAGFLPEQSDTINDPRITGYTQHVSTEVFELKDILKLQVTFQGSRLNEADKIALLSFLQTMSEMKDPR